MQQHPCDGDIRKNFRVVANIIVIGIILSAAGVVISILTIVNYYAGYPIFPFSGGIDPPYLGIACIVSLVLFIVMAFSLHKIKEKTCKTLELPLI